MLHRQVCTRECGGFFCSKVPSCGCVLSGVVWCVETQSWEGTSAQVVTVLTHTVNLLKLRVLTHGFTPVTSLQIPVVCLPFLCLAGLGALLQLLFLFPFSPPGAGGHLPMMELLLKPSSGLLSASYSQFPSPNVPPGPIFFLLGRKEKYFFLGLAAASWAA